MSWFRVVIRQDSPIRWYNIATCMPHLADDRTLHAVVDRTLADHHGAYQVDKDQFDRLARTYAEISRTEPRFFLDKAAHYMEMADEWFRFLEGIVPEIPTADDAQLLAWCEQFNATYRDYSPVLYLPFAAEHRYRLELPNLLRSATERAAAAITHAVSNLGPVGELAAGFAYRPDTNEGMNWIKAAFEVGTELTLSERYQDELLALAARMREHPDWLALWAERTPSVRDLAMVPGLGDEVERLQREYAWLRCWGYPPHYPDPGEDSITADIADALRGSPRQALEERRGKRAELTRRRELVMDMMGATPEERSLIETVCFFNYFRTYRMELLLKAQFLSRPLLAAVGKRAGLEGDDVYYLIPPEFEGLLRRREIPPDLQKRKDGWYLLANRDTADLLVAERAGRFRARFEAVVEHDENGRGHLPLDNALVGGKASGLLRLKAGGFRVPPFFVVTTRAWQSVATLVGFDRLVEESLPVLQSALRNNDDAAFQAACDQLASAIAASPIPPEVMDAVREAWTRLGFQRAAVRSSANVEDAVKSSWAGRFDSKLHIGFDELEEAIQRVWQSAFSPRALRYSLDTGQDIRTIRMAAVVQEYLTADFSGVIESSRPAGGGFDVVVEVCRGEGFPLVDGIVTPARFVVRVAPDGTPEVLQDSRPQQSQVGRQGALVQVEAARVDIPIDTIVALVREARTIEKHLGSPQDIELAILDGQCYWLQSRPLTGYAASGDSPATPTADGMSKAGRLLTQGLRGVVAARYRGKTRVLKSPNEHERVQSGDVTVMNAATPAWDRVLYRAGAIITDEGGSTCHAIRVANERGIPAVVGCTDATGAVADDADVIVDTTDAWTGRIWTEGNQ